MGLRNRNNRPKGVYGIQTPSITKGNSSMRVKELLEIKGRQVITLQNDRTVDDAIRLMVENQTSAVIVLEKNRPVGIFAERDVLRAYRSNPNAAFADMPIKTAMTTRLITVTGDTDVHTATEVLVKADIRHLPVKVEDAIAGMLLANDLVEYQLAELNAEVHHLKEYIHDLHDAGQD
jgi:IMP dehydrogenase